MASPGKGKGNQAPQPIRDRDPFLDPELGRLRDFLDSAQRDALRTYKPTPAPKLKASKAPGRRHLVIGDAHAHPEHNNFRFDWLGRMITDLQPDVVVDIGDSADMHSLCSYDDDRPGIKGFERRSFEADVLCYIDSRRRLQIQMDDFWRGRKSPKRPELYKTNGNHEHRITRLLEREPKYRDAISIEKLMDREFGWAASPYLDPLIIDGITYVHVFKQTGSDRPIARGVNLCRSVGLNYHLSGVFGHTHIFGHWDGFGGFESRLSIFNAGCFFDYDPPYAGSDTRVWRRGILELNGVHEGAIESWRWHSLDEIRRRYS